MRKRKWKERAMRMNHLMSAATVEIQKADVEAKRQYEIASRTQLHLETNAKAFAETAREFLEKIEKLEKDIDNLEACRVENTELRDLAAERLNAKLKADGEIRRLELVIKSKDTIIDGLKGDAEHESIEHAAQIKLVCLNEGRAKAGRDGLEARCLGLGDAIKELNSKIISLEDLKTRQEFVIDDYEKALNETKAERDKTAKQLESFTDFFGQTVPAWEGEMATEQERAAAVSKFVLWLDAEGLDRLEMIRGAMPRPADMRVTQRISNNAVIAFALSQTSQLIGLKAAGGVMMMPPPPKKKRPSIVDDVRASKGRRKTSGRMDQKRATKARNARVFKKAVEIAESEGGRGKKSTKR